MREIGFGHYVCQSCQHEVKTDMLEDVMKEKARRRDFMRVLYKESGGSEYSYFDEYEIGKELGFDRETVGTVIEYLMGENLLTGTVGGAVAITHQGVREVEDWIEHPDHSTPHFPAVSVINIGTMSNSQIMQGSQHSTQTETISITQNDLHEIEAFIKEYRRCLPELNFSDEQREQAEVGLQTAEMHLKSSKPNVAILRIAVESLAALLTHTSAILLAEGIMKYFPHFFH